jgi:phosphopantothenoylcysteine decarboxylase/phosphopantothenate--cysteine ligase
VGDEAPGTDAVLMAAAVADFRPGAAAETKLKKESLGQQLAVTLERTEDILAGLGKRSAGSRPLLVGFAAETGDLEQKAASKLAAKGCDLLVANDVSAADAGFEVETNRVLLFDESGSEALPLMTKRQVAARVLDRIRDRLRPVTR